MDSTIEVKITISEDEFKDWNEFHSDGIDGVKMQLQSDFKDSCKRLGIRNADIEIIHNE